MGCELTAEIEDGKVVSVTGNTCGVGKKYAETEITAPVRTVTSTVMSDKGRPVPVKTKSPIPKDKIFDVMKDIKAAVITLPVKIGDTAVANVAGTGVDIIVTKEIS